MDRVIEIVEPTLESAAGHCGSFVESLCAAGRGSGWTMRVWAGRRARRGADERPEVEVRPYFFRRARRVQALFLYRRLLSGPGRILVPTAGRADLALLSLAAGGRGVPPGKVFLYFHWIRPAPGKIASLKRMAARLPGATVLGPTPSVVGTLSACGFADARLAPYPITPSGGFAARPPGRFTHLLFAGGARADKGFARVVDLVALLAARHDEIPVTIQVSPDRYDKCDPAVKADIRRLRALAYPPLRTVDEALGEREYAALYGGAICLQPYLREDFADRISGVTLDALSAGCPVIVTAGTWMARAVDRFGAGIVVPELSPERLLDAVHAVRDDYGRFAKNAGEAGGALQEELCARRLFGIVTGERDE